MDNIIQKQKNEIIFISDDSDIEEEPKIRKKVKESNLENQDKIPSVKNKHKKTKQQFQQDNPQQIGESDKAYTQRFIAKYPDLQEDYTKEHQREGKKRYQKHKETENEKNEIWQKNHPEKLKESKKKHHQKESVKKKQADYYNNKYYPNNKAKLLKEHANWRKKNPKKSSLYCKNFRQTHPGHRKKYLEQLPEERKKEIREHDKVNHQKKRANRSEEEKEAANEKKRKDNKNHEDILWIIFLFLYRRGIIKNEYDKSDKKKTKQRHPDFRKNMLI